MGVPEPGVQDQHQSEQALVLSLSPLAADYARAASSAMGNLLGGASLLQDASTGSKHGSSAVAFLLV
jgi:hypothetical protein